MALSINCDMGESYGLYTMGEDAAIMPYITLANVACGFHASDPSVMPKTVRLATEHGMKVGAYPSLSDLQGFGRREMAMEPSELRDSVLYQVGALKAFHSTTSSPAEPCTAWRQCRQKWRTPCATPWRYSTSRCSAGRSPLTRRCSRSAG